MIKSESFRLSKATFGVRLEDGKVVEAVQMPRDSMIAIVSGVEDPHKMIEVDWHGLRVRVFARDVQESRRVGNPFKIISDAQPSQA